MHGSKFDDVARGLGRGASRRTIVKGLAGGFAGMLAGGLRRNASAARTLTICHATGNAEQPYESMTIDQAEFNLHARHGDYLRSECCADSDCASLDGDCGSGTCQNGYCVQLPKPAGTICGEGDLCTEPGYCDGAMNCLGAGGPVSCPPPIDECYLSSCDPASGCTQTPNVGAACTPDATHDGVCDAQGICQPILVCTAAATCSSDSDCASGENCINGGCFLACTSTSQCTGSCASCTCSLPQEGGGGSRRCLDSGTYIGQCLRDSDCPTGSLCSRFISSGSGLLCTQPCKQLR